MDFTSFEVDPLTIKETKKMKIEEFYKILGLRGTVKILKYLNEQGKARYIDLSFIISYASLNTRLTQLETLNIIEHHFNRGKEKREEWYELTEKGKKLILIFDQLEEIINE
ncbi:MAG: winged helix-turn-helix transcriptional regulator [Theionarchaea archaeon]|nr:winged helix-turn-helix transcriptional regulator [Theionarchaea archaeon]